MVAFYGDFAKDGTYAPGILGTRLLTLVRRIDPSARIESTGIDSPSHVSLAVAKAVGDMEGLRSDNRNSIVRDITDIVEREGIAALDTYGAPRGFEDAWRIGVAAAKAAPKLNYPSIVLTPKMREAVAQGLPMFGALPAAQRFASALPHVTPKLLPQEWTTLKQRIEEAIGIVSRIAGKNVRVRLYDQIPIDQSVTEDVLDDLRRRGYGMSDTAGGYYDMQLNAPSVIGLAVNDPEFDIRETAGHEAFHHVKEALATPAEKRVLAHPSEQARMRKLAAKVLGYDPDGTHMLGLPDYEVEAYAFQHWRQMREEGAQGTSLLHRATQNLFDRILKVLRGVANVLRGLGYDSFESIFDRARSGEIAQRSDFGVLGSPDRFAGRLGSIIPMPFRPSLRDKMMSLYMRLRFGNNRDVAISGEALQAIREGGSARRAEDVARRGQYSASLRDELFRLQRDTLNDIDMMMMYTQLARTTRLHVPNIGEPANTNLKPYDYAVREQSEKRTKAEFDRVLTRLDRIVNDDLGPASPSWNRSGPRLIYDQAAKPSDFMSERVVADDGASVNATTLYEAYVQWVEDRGAGKPLSLRDFGQTMVQTGLMRQTIAGRIRYVGIALKPSQGPQRLGSVLPTKKVDAGRPASDIIDLIREIVADDAGHGTAGQGLAGSGHGAKSQGHAEGRQEEDQDHSGSGAPAANERRQFSGRLRYKTLTDLLGDRLSAASVRSRAMTQGFTRQGWHGTNAADMAVPDPFRNGKDFGFHVALGNPKAANSRIGYPQTLGERLNAFLERMFNSPEPRPQPEEGGNVIPIRLRMSRPLEMPDIANARKGLAYNWTDPVAWLDILRQSRDADAKLVDWLKDWIWRHRSDISRRTSLVDHKFSRDLAAKLSELGYDGVIYTNALEAPGSKSAFVWNPDQVRSAFDAFDDRAAGDVGLMASLPYLEADARTALNDLLVEEGLSPIDFDETFQPALGGNVEPQDLHSDLLRLPERQAGDITVAVTGPVYGPVTYVAKDAKGREIGSFRLRVMDHASVSVTNAKVEAKERRKGVARRVYGMIRSDVEARGYRLLPQGVDEAQMSEDAFRFWMAFDPAAIVERNKSYYSMKTDTAKARVAEAEAVAKPKRLGSVLPSRPPGTRTPAAPGAVMRRVQRYMARYTQRLDSARVLLQDRALPIRRVQEQIERVTAHSLPIDLDTYVAEALYHGRAGERMTDVQTKWFEPLMERLRAADITGDQLGDYLYARHAQERNEKVGVLHEPGTDLHSAITDHAIIGASGVSTDWANRKLAEVRASGKQSDYDALAGIIDDMQEETRKTLLRAGLIDRETYNNWSTVYANYAPLRGFELGEEENPDRARTGHGFDIRGPEAMRALGRRSKADNPVLYAFLQAEQAIVRAEKNRVAKTLYRTVTAHPNPVLWKIYKGEYRQRVNPSTGLVEKYWVPPAFVHADNIHGVKIGGKQHWIELKHAGLARAMRGVGSEIQGTVIGRVFQGVMRFYAGLLTSWNPEFLFSNMLRDITTALVNVSDVAERPEGIRRQILKDAVSLKAIRGALQALRGDPTASEYSRWFEEFRHAGGRISFMGFNDVERIRSQIETALNQSDVRRAFRSAMQLVEDMNTAVENGVRLSVYAALRRAGINKDRAAFVARELTVNFNRKGEYGPALNAAYLFFNASVQGTVRIAQAITRSKTVRLGVASIMATGFALDILNYLLAGNDDDGENVYDKIPGWIKERNLILMNWGSAKHDYLMIPLPYGYNVFHLAGQNMAAVLRGAEKPTAAAANVSSAILESFNPLGSSVSFWQFVSPTILDPGVQMLENKTWYGGPIYPTKYDKLQPDSESYFASAPSWAVEMARWLNSATGGNKARSGYIDVSPETIEHLGEFLAGGVGKFMMNAINTGERLIGGEDWLPEKTPIIRRLYGKTTVESRRREFFEAWDPVDAAHYEVKELTEARQPDAANDARKRYANELRAYPEMKSTLKALQNFRKQREAVEERHDLAEEIKRTKIDDIVKRENEMIVRALTQYHNILKQPSKESLP
jgi:hypothetical protein